ncbi:hypothetical protein ACFW9L_16600 [Streptomyces sp. NPDC059517]|uniref:hypothetical protein n=1 Tax=Streptomyces sp. NPDC059517 TaxID=3346855 RepID=UPI003688A88D
MAVSSTHLVLLCLALLCTVLVALLASVGAALLARWDGATTPAVLLRAAIAFGSTLTLLLALITLIASTVT